MASKKNDTQKSATVVIYLGVSENRGTPKSSISIGSSIINHSILGYPYFLETPISTPWGVSRLASFFLGQMSGWRRRSWEAEREILLGIALQGRGKTTILICFPICFLQEFLLKYGKCMGRWGRGVSLLGVHGEILSHSLVTDGDYKGEHQKGWFAGHDTRCWELGLIGTCEPIPAKLVLMVKICWDTAIHLFSLYFYRHILYLWLRQSTYILIPAPGL